MQAESSSAESKLTTASNSVLDITGYKCQNCSRVFNSSRARGGHQIAHRKKRPIRREKGAPPMNPILAAVLAHHISSDDDDDERPPPPPPTLPAKAQPVNDAAELTCKNESSSYKPQKKKQQLQLQTKDLLGLWNPRAGSSEIFSSSSSSSTTTERVTLDLFTREPEDDESDDLDLELKLLSKNSEKVSLKLKLGF